MNQLSSAGNRFCFCRSEGCPVCLPFPGSPGSARKCKGEVSAWEIKGSQGKMTLWKWELDIPAQWEGCVRKHLNQPFGYFGYSREKFNLLFKRRDFFYFPGNTFCVRRAKAANNFHNKHPPFKIRNRNCQLN